MRSIEVAAGYVPRLGGAALEGLGKALMPTRAQKITFGELRASGLNRVIVYCREYTCSQFHNAQRPAAALISPSAASRSD